MTTGHYVRCNSCERTVFIEEVANGWFVLKTLLTQEPEIDLPEDFNPFDRAQVEKLQEEARAKLPPSMHGEFCTVKCLMNFVNAHFGLEDIKEDANE